MKASDIKNLSLKQILILFFGSLVVLAGYSAVFGEFGYLSLRKSERKLKGFNLRIEQLKKENQDIRGEIRSLKKDPKAIEKIAREELGLVREGEIKMSPGKKLENPSKPEVPPEIQP